MPITDTPLRYPGGETQLAPFVANYFAQTTYFSAYIASPLPGVPELLFRLLLDGTIAEALDQ